MSDTLGKPMHVTYSATTSDGTLIASPPHWTGYADAVTHLVVGSRGAPWERTWHILRYTSSEESARSVRRSYMRGSQSGRYGNVEVLPATITPA